MWQITFPVLVFVGTILGLLFEIKLIAVFAYLLAWWSYIFAVDAWCLRKGYPTVFYPKVWHVRNIWLLYVSALSWLIFEFYNFFIKNWHYVNIPEPAIIWVPGTLIAFATVLPGIFVTRNLIYGLGWFRKLRIRAFTVRSIHLYLMTALGAAFTILPLTQPKIFFPFVWGGLLFLLVPLNYRSFDFRSVLRQLSQGKPGIFLELLVAGLFCGFLWESLNFWSLAKWKYTVPVIGNLKLFEMPIVGFLGFPPYAVEAYVIWLFVDTRWKKWDIALRIQIAGLSTFFVAAVLIEMGRRTVTKWLSLGEIFWR